MPITVLYEPYILIFYFLVLSLVLSLVIMVFSLLLTKSLPDLEKNSSYECGFEPFEDARNQFDVRFYIIAILFIIFDVEVLYLFPWVICLKEIGLFGFWVMFIFLMVLAVGFIYEFFRGALEWQ
jgi:NADH-quinone oxidoreductase subunit A